MIFRLTRYYSNEDKKKSDLGPNALTYGLSGLGAGGAALGIDHYRKFGDNNTYRMKSLEAALLKQEEVEKDLRKKFNDKVSSAGDIYHTRMLNRGAECSRFRKLPNDEELRKKAMRTAANQLNEEQLKAVIDSYKEEFNGKPYKLMEGNNTSTSIAAHEFGHYNIEKGKAGKLAKFTQDIHHNPIFNIGDEWGGDTFKKQAARVGMHMIPGVATGTTGFKVDEDTGDVKLRKASLIAPALGIALPFVRTHHEKVASKEAMKLLKELGASEKYLKLSKENLKNAYNSYTFDRNARIAANTAASGFGYLANGLRAKRKGDRIKEEKERRREERDKFLNYKEGE